jgi:hypothetical protein
VSRPGVGSSGASVATSWPKMMQCRTGQGRAQPVLRASMPHATARASSSASARACGWRILQSESSRPGRSRDSEKVRFIPVEPSRTRRGYRVCWGPRRDNQTAPRVRRRRNGLMRSQAKSSVVQECPKILGSSPQYLQNRRYTLVRPKFDPKPTTSAGAGNRYPGPP